MRIFNEEKTQILENVDLTLGFLKPDTITISEEQQEEFHYEEKHYDNGGVAKYRVIDKPYKEAELEQIEVYVLYTEKELAQNKLNELINWFDNYFDKQLTQSQWQDDFTVSHDDYFNKYYANIDELKAQAKLVRGEIRKLREGGVK